MAPAFGATWTKSTSPTRVDPLASSCLRRFSSAGNSRSTAVGSVTRLIPTSMTVAPARTCWGPKKANLPIAAIKMSAC